GRPPPGDTGNDRSCASPGRHGPVTATDGGHPSGRRRARREGAAL
ncbi:MAG: hypothetical protein AVDCRST_MAG52-3291, partial [uncultured Blastococcus sp.]